MAQKLDTVHVHRDTEARLFVRLSGFAAFWNWSYWYVRFCNLDRGGVRLERADNKIMYETVFVALSDVSRASMRQCAKDVRRERVVTLKHKGDTSQFRMVLCRKACQKVLLQERESSKRCEQ